MLVDEVTLSTSPCALSKSFGALYVEKAVLVCDSQTGFRVGLIIVFDAAYRVAVTRLPPPSELYYII